MINNLYISAIIPARGGSKRLPQKNIYPIWNKPMIYWTIKACKHSKYIDDIYVSTESQKIKNIVQKYNVKIINRPKKIADDKTLKQHVICHAFKKISNSSKYKKPNIIVSIQANSPDIKPHNIDAAIEKLIKYNRWEILSMDKNLLQNGAFRIQRSHVVCQKSLSAVTGAYIVNCANIHDIKDVKKIESKYRKPPKY
ncbi:MAG: acylneuraminate cytidylyltransferase family protein [Promethearchaeota archaeon]